MEYINFSAEKLQSYTEDMLRKMGATEDEAVKVTRELINSNLAGVDSHGVLRLPEYYNSIKEKYIVPGAPLEIVKETTNTFILDTHNNWGHYGALRATELVIEKARKHGVAVGITLHSTHVGRIGSYTDMIASAGLLALAICGVYTVGPMKPFGGDVPKIGTNPYSWAVPRKNGNIVLDMATTAVAEGKVRFYYLSGKQVPTGWLCDADGCSTNDPAPYYEKREGAILPAGGYKGSGMGIFANLFSIALANREYWSWKAEGKPHPDQHNGFFLIAIDPECFFGLDAFKEMAEIQCQFIKDTPPDTKQGFTEVMLPGEIELRNTAERLKNGIEVPIDSWKLILGTARELGCEWAKE